MFWACAEGGWGQNAKEDHESEDLQDQEERNTKMVGQSGEGFDEMDGSNEMDGSIVEEAKAHPGL